MYKARLNFYQEEDSFKKMLEMEGVCLWFIAWIG